MSVKAGGNRADELSKMHVREANLRQWEDSTKACWPKVQLFPLDLLLSTTTRGHSDLAWVTSPHSCAPWLIIRLLPNPVELRPKINHRCHTRTPGFCHSLSNRPRQAPFRFIPVTWLNLIAKKTMKSNLYSWSPCAKQKTCWLQHKKEMGAGEEVI